MKATGSVTAAAWIVHDVFLCACPCIASSIGQAQNTEVDENTIACSGSFICFAPVKVLGTVDTGMVLVGLVLLLILLL
jgi:hypothetical protein